MNRILLAALAVCVLATPSLRADVPELVGRLAVALEAADELGISERQVERLEQLVQVRTDEGLELLLDIKDLPVEEQDAKLRPYQLQSERLGQQILGTSLWRAVVQLDIRQRGLASVLDPTISGVLRLTDEQQSQAEELLGDLRTQIGLANAETRQRLRIDADRRLRNLLTNEQYAAWQRMAGESPETTPASDSAQPSPTGVADTADTADTEPASDDERTASSQPPRTTPQTPSRGGFDRGRFPTRGGSTAPTPSGVDSPGALVERSESPGTTSDQPMTLIPGTEPPSDAETDVAETDTPAPDRTGVPSRGAFPSRSTQPSRTADSNRTPTTSRTESPRPSTTVLPRVAGDSPRAEAQLRFNFRFQPWSEVLDWFARQADLSIVMDAPPPGTFNYSDTRTYSPAEAIDLLNSVLLTKGYTLVRRERMLLVVNLEDGIPPNLVPYIPLNQLDERGEFELIKVLFPLRKLSPGDAQAEIQPLLGPQGSAVSLERARQVLVTETAGRLRTIRSVIEAVEGPGPSDGDLEVIQLEHTLAEDVMPLIRQLFDMSADRNGLDDGTLQIAVDPLGTRLMVTGRSDRVARVKQIVEITDKPLPGTEGEVGPLDPPQLEVYSITTADSEAVLQVMQTLLAGEEGVRLAIDPKTGNLVALGRNPHHATIRATLDQMQRDSRQVEVIRLRYIDPGVALLAVQGLFGIGGDDPDPRAPKIEANPNTGQLLVRGSQAQIDQIRMLLEKMGEADGEGPEGLFADRGNVRVVPLPARSTDALLDQLEQLWPSVRPNRLRVVRPAQGSNGAGGNGNGSIRIHTPPGLDSILPYLPEALDPNRREPERSAEPEGPQARLAPPARPRGVRAVALRQVDEDQPQPAAPEQPVEEGTITILRTPNGLILSGDDPEALDDLESLLSTLSSGSFAGGREFSIFYLKSANALVVSEMLDQLLGMGGGGGDAGGGGGLLGGMAEAAFGDFGGGLFGSLLGLGGGGDSFLGSTSLSIVPDPRLNALIVQGSPNDVDAIEQLLEVLDQQDPPETDVASKPRLIPVENQPAATIAATLRQVYADRMVGAGGQQRQPSPEEFIQMLRGGGGGGRGGRGGRGGGGGSDDQRTKMSIGVDERTNSLVIVSPEDLFQEVSQLVETLDTAPVNNDEVMEVVALKRTNAAAVQQALVAIVGPQVQSRTTPSPTGESSSGESRRSTPDQAAQFRQQADFFNNLRRTIDTQGGGRGGPPASVRGGPPTGGGGRGGRGGR